MAVKDEAFDYFIFNIEPPTSDYTTTLSSMPNEASHALPSIQTTVHQYSQADDRTLSALRAVISDRNQFATNNIYPNYYNTGSRSANNDTIGLQMPNRYAAKELSDSHPVSGTPLLHCNPKTEIVSPLEQFGPAKRSFAEISTIPSDQARIKFARTEIHSNSESGLAGCSQLSEQHYGKSLQLQSNYRRILPKSGTQKVIPVKPTQSNTPKTSLRCQECGANFFSQIALNFHLCNNRGDQKFHCQQCNKQFSRKQYLTYHMMSHRVQSYGCPICSKMFSSDNLLNEHMVEHKIRLLYMCIRCGKEAEDLPFLLEHIKKHNLEDTTCKISPDTPNLNQKSIIDSLHVKTEYDSDTVNSLHDEDLEKRTEIISADDGENAGTAVSITDVSQSSLTCCFCKFSSDGITAMISHVTDLHSASQPLERNGVFICRICSNTQSTSTAAYIHLLSKHSQDRQFVITMSVVFYQCSMCDFRSQFKKLLVKHVSFMHASVKNAVSKVTRGVQKNYYQCSVCPAIFEQFLLTKDHITSVHGYRVKPIDNSMAVIKQEIEDKLGAGVQTVMEDNSVEVTQAAHVSEIVPLPFTESTTGIEKINKTFAEDVVSTSAKDSAIKIRAGVFKCRECSYKHSTIRGVHAHYAKKCGKQYSSNQRDLSQLSGLQSQNEATVPTSLDEDNRPRVSNYMCNECSHVYISKRGLQKHMQLNHGLVINSTQADQMKITPVLCKHEYKPSKVKNFSELGELNMNLGQENTDVYRTAGPQKNQSSSLLNKLPSSSNAGRVQSITDEGGNQVDPKKNTDNINKENKQQSVEVIENIQSRLKKSVPIISTASSMDSNKVTTTDNNSALISVKKNPIPCYVCNQCSFVYMSKPGLQKHMRVCHNVIISMHEAGQMIAVSVSDQNKSTNTYHATKSHSVAEPVTQGCNMLQQPIVTSVTESIKLADCVANNEYACAMCSDTFLSSDELYEHILYFHNVDKLPGVQCQQNLSMLMNQVKQVVNISGDTSKRRVCPLCHATHVSVKYFRDHLKNRHGINYQDYLDDVNPPSSQCVTKPNQQEMPVSVEIESLPMTVDNPLVMKSKAFGNLFNSSTIASYLSADDDSVHQKTKVVGSSEDSCHSSQNEAHTQEQSPHGSSSSSSDLSIAQKSSDPLKSDGAKQHGTLTEDDSVSQTDLNIRCPLYPYCHWQFKNKRSISRHAIEFHKTTCVICGLVFKNIKQWKAHVSSCHSNCNVPERKTDNLHCEFCTYTFTNKNKYLRHMQHHNLQSKCKFCDFRSKYNYSLWLHRLKHINIEHSEQLTPDEKEVITRAKICNGYKKNAVVVDVVSVLKLLQKLDTKLITCDGNCVTKDTYESDVGNYPSDVRGIPKPCNSDVTTNGDRVDISKTSNYCVNTFKNTYKVYGSETCSYGNHNNSPTIELTERLSKPISDSDVISFPGVSGRALGDVKSMQLKTGNTQSSRSDIVMNIPINDLIDQCLLRDAYVQLYDCSDVLKQFSAIE